jgi:4a-hydroxytetrahydrobiopterin dehydratase
MKILITESQIKKLKSEWKVVNDKLCKRFKFDSYSDVLDFVNRVGEIAEKQNHHPDMIVKYNEVIVTMFDHEANKISDKCYKFTNAVDKMEIKKES